MHVIYYEISLKNTTLLFFSKKQITKNNTLNYKNLPRAWKCNKSSFFRFVQISKMQNPKAFSCILLKFWGLTSVTSPNFVLWPRGLLLSNWLWRCGLQSSYWEFWITFSYAERSFYIRQISAVSWSYDFWNSSGKIKKPLNFYFFGFEKC